MSGYGLRPNPTYAASCRRGSQRKRVAELCAGVQEFLRINGFAFDAGFVVQMRPGGAPGVADAAHDLSDLHRLSEASFDRGQVAIACGEAVAVIDLNHPAVAAAPARDDDRAGCGGADRIADLSME